MTDNSDRHFGAGTQPKVGAGQYLWLMHEQGEEQPLTGGNVTSGVVRVGNTVRRPSGPWSSSVHALLCHLAGVGYAGAPRSLGFDEQGRHVVEWVEGDCRHPYLGPDDEGLALGAVGRIIREFHDAARGFVPPADAVWNVVIEPDKANFICHHDLAGWNFVDGVRRGVFIDWDTAAPGSALWDLAWAVHGFVQLDGSVSVALVMRRLSHLANGYALTEDERRNLVALLPTRARSMVELLRRGHETGTQPWRRLWLEGHGETWQIIERYSERHQEQLLQAVLG
jgi:hypothetical protein